MADEDKGKLSPLDKRTASPLVAGTGPLAANNGTLDGLAMPTDNKLSAETLSALAASAAAGRAAYDAARRDLRGDLKHAVKETEQKSAKMAAADENTPVVPGPKKSFSMSRDDAIFWCGLTLLGGGLSTMSPLPIIGTSLVLAGISALAWANRGHMPKPPWRLAALILAMALTCGFASYDLYDRHFGGRLTPSAALTSTSTSSATNVLCLDGPCPPAHVKAGPEYLKQIGIGADQEGRLSFGATSAVTVDRLRVFVDYSEYYNGWMPKVRAYIGEIKEPVKGQFSRLQLINIATQANGGTNNLWWGKPSDFHAVSNEQINSLMPAIPIRARLVIIGQGDTEQHYYFTLLRAITLPGAYKIGVLQEHESGDWIASWEQE